jgi:hypothetical protein
MDADSDPQKNTFNTEDAEGAEKDSQPLMAQMF